MVLYRCLLLLLAALLASLPAQAQILRGGQCRPTFINVQLGGTVCERLCYRRGHRGPPILCRRVYSSGKLPVCGNGCCISGPNCLQLLRT